MTRSPGGVPVRSQNNIKKIGRIQRKSEPQMKETETNQQAVQKAGKDFIARMLSKYSRMESLGLDVTEDDLATHMEAEILAGCAAGHTGRGPHSDPPHPAQTNLPSGAVLPFPRHPTVLPMSA